jgi:RNA polymerase sigma-70 factor, ECF subfamily
MRPTRRARSKTRPLNAATADADVDDAVLSRARAGDAAAFTEVVRHYDGRLRALAFRLLGDRTAMDDALQDAYVKAFRALPQFRGDSALGTWLYRITYRACVDHQRRESRQQVLPWPGAGPELSRRSAAGAAEPSATAAARVDLVRALSALPVDQRAAVLLVDAEGLDYGTAAAVLGVAPGTIASRLSRARAALRTALAEGESR